MEKQLKVLNMEIVAEAKELMNERFPMMVKYFLEDTAMYIEEIRRGVEEDNAEIAISPAHTIKSSAKQLGAERVSDTSKLIEELCRNITENKSSNLQELKLLYDNLKQEFENVSLELEKLA
jgi:HPt (histidine-containing phosphotransfer) domain-containing protein